MNKDKLKDFIEEERASFEMEEPREGLWEDIRAELHPADVEEPKRRKSLWSIAASLVMLMGLGTILFLMTRDTDKPEGFAERTEASVLDLSMFGEEMAEVDRYYSIQVGSKMKELSAYDVDEEFMEEMEFLNEEFEMLRSEMGQGIDDSKVVEALIENYRLRLSLLEDLLEAVESAKNEKDDEVYQEL